MKRTEKIKRIVARAFVVTWGVEHFAPWRSVKAVGLVAMLVLLCMWLWVVWEPNESHGTDKPAN